MLSLLIISANQERMPEPVAPLGAVYVAAAARRAGHKVAVYDACFAGDQWPAELASALERSRPDVVGVSIRNVDNVAWPRAHSYLPHYEHVVAVVRQAAPASKVVVGGAAFTLFPEEFLARLGADYGVVGEGERLIVELLRQIERFGDVREQIGTGSGEQPTIFYAGSTGDFDALEPPARELVDMDRYWREGGSANVQSKRGCPFQCSYCTYPVLEGARVRTRNPRAVLDEMEEVRARHGVDYFFFVDNVFNTPPDHAAAVCEEILRRGQALRWTAYVTPAGLDRELLALMVRAGCRSVDFGTDAVCDVTLERLHKSFRARDVLEVSAWCRDLKLKFNHSLILGGPGETWETLEETVRNAVETRSTSVIASMGVRVHRNTELAEQTIREGLVTRGQIGVTPLFYIADAVREGLPAFLSKVADQHPNWVVPGLGRGTNERYFARVRARGVKGPLWELLAPEPGTPPVP